MYDCVPFSDKYNSSLKTQMNEFLESKLEEFKETSPLFQDSLIETISKDGHLLINGNIPQFSEEKRVKFWKCIEENHQTEIISLISLEKSLIKLVDSTFQEQDYDYTPIKDAIYETVEILKKDDILLKRLSILKSQNITLFQESIIKAIISTRIGINNSLRASPSQVFTATLFSDIGELATPEMIYPSIRKVLSASQIALYNQHPIISCLLFDRNLFPEEVTHAILTHHLTLNNTGYPKELFKFETTPESQLLNITNTFIEMITRDKRQSQEALKLLDFFSQSENSLGESILPTYNRKYYESLSELKMSCFSNNVLIKPKITDRKDLVSIISNLINFGENHQKDYMSRLERNAIEVISKKHQDCIDLLYDTSQKIQSLTRFVSPITETEINSLSLEEYNSLATDVELLCDEIGRYSLNLIKHNKEITYSLQDSNLMESSTKYLGKIIGFVNSTPTKPLQKYLSM